MTDTTEFEEMERDGWADPSIASGYADGFEHATLHCAEVLAQKAGAGQGAEILDLCTGHGVVAAELVRHGAKVTGLDFSEAMIALARQSVPDALFVQGDALAMTFADGSFDAVTIGFGVPHFPDPARGLAEAARVVRPGGKIAFSIWLGQGSQGAFGWLFDAVGRIGDPSVTLPPGPDAHMLSDPSVAEPMVTDAGFTEFELMEVPTQLLVAAPDRLFDVFDKGAVRAASLLGGQPAELRDKIRADLAERTKAEGEPGQNGYLVAAPCAVISAIRS